MKLNPAVGGIRIWPILLVFAILLAAVAAHGAAAPASDAMMMKKANVRNADRMGILLKDSWSGQPETAGQTQPG